MTTTLESRLEHANHVRVERARLKRMLSSGTLTLGEAFEEPVFQRMLLFDLLLALPTLRPAKVRRDRRVTLLATTLFAHLQRSPLTLVESITDREKRILVYAYRRHQEGVN